MESGPTAPVCNADGDFVSCDQAVQSQALQAAA